MPESIKKVAQLMDGFYAGETQQYGRGLPGNAVLDFPPAEQLPEHHRWRYLGHGLGQNGSGYEMVADYRGQMIYRPDGSTYYPTNFGPLPNGDSLTPPPPGVEDVIKNKLAEVMSGYSAAFAPVEAIYPANEREGWPIQLEEARAVQVNPDAAVPTLSAMVAERGMGESVVDFAALVIGNNELYRAVYASLTGQQQRMFRDVQSLAATAGITANEVEAYPVEYRMPKGLSYGVL